MGQQDQEINRLAREASNGCSKAYNYEVKNSTLEFHWKQAKELPNSVIGTILRILSDDYPTQQFYKCVLWESANRIEQQED